MVITAAFRNYPGEERRRGLAPTVCSEGERHMSYLLMVMVIGLLILIHELGHLAAAKYTRIPVARFSVGFGPKLWGFRRKETEYQISAIPLGGYVLPKIEDIEEYSRLPLRKQILFSAGGPAANILAALFCISIGNAVTSGLSLPSVLIGPFEELFRTTRQIVSAIPIFFDHPEKLSGIIGIVAFGGQQAGLDASRLLSYSILLNVNLAIFNLLPLPPLDGGKMVFSVLQSICRPLSRLQVPVAIAGWALMIVLTVYTSAIDIGRLWAGWMSA